MSVVRRLLPFVLGVVLIACEDDATGPSNLELAFVAHNFAELGRSREDAGNITAFWIRLQHPHVLVSYPVCR